MMQIQKTEPCVCEKCKTPLHAGRVGDYCGQLWCENYEKILPVRVYTTSQEKTKRESSWVMDENPRDAGFFFCYLSVITDLGEFTRKEVLNFDGNEWLQKEGGKVIAWYDGDDEQKEIEDANRGYRDL